MKDYQFVIVRHILRDKSTGPPIYHIRDSEGAFVFSSNNEDVARDVKYLLETARFHRGVEFDILDHKEETG